MSNINKNKIALVLFSGGKDSVFALHKAIEEGFTPIIVSFVNSDGNLQLTDGVEMRNSFLVHYLKKFKFEYHIIYSDFEKLNYKIISSLNKIIKNNNIRDIYTGDINHLNGINFFLEKKLDNFIKINTPAKDYYNKFGSLSYIEHLNKLGFNMVITGIRSDVYSNLTILRKLSNEYAEEILKKDIDCTGEDGEFQTLVTNCYLMKEGINVPNCPVLEYLGRDKFNYKYKSILLKE